MINNVTLVGRLTNDVELRYTGNGTAVGSFTLAVERSYTNSQGERETDFIRCVIWRKSAETMANFTTKGSRVGVTGRIQTRTYQDNDGKTVYMTEVVADNFQMLESKAETDQRRAQQGGGNSYNNSNNSGYSNNQSFSNNQSQQSTNQAPRNNQNNNFSTGDDNDPFEKNDDVIDISDDDLPF